ncbi:ACT domain-containing protein ACR4-like [Lycium barbarum]|uniref:ACT domain-containing protein ACR4-like n=1 Tax=Lycium barbarum TaxID=112863 RepID=UPI00293F63F7|nr:ACT domain-containing protein ACR4-like [Lycium barbarum]
MSYSQNIMDDEYEKFIRRMNPPRVVIDNESCKNATVIQVDSANKHGILLEVVQVLTDLNFVIPRLIFAPMVDGSYMDGKDIFLFVSFDLAFFSVDFCHVFW